MKKRIRNLFLALLFTTIFIPFLNVNAASAVVDIYASNKKPTVGSSITVTVYVKSSSPLGSYFYDLVYDSSKLKLTSGEISNTGYPSNNTTTSLSKTFSFKVIGAGSSSISAKNVRVIDFEEQNMSTSVSGTTISSYVKVNTPVVYSTNNNLSNLTVSGYTLSPTFNKNTTEYKVTLKADATEITVNATKEDNTAKVTGAGIVKVTEGENKINIVVTSQKGTTKTYTIIATVVDESPINVTIDNKKYTVIKRKNSLENKDNFKETTIKINNTDIPVLQNEVTKYTLVGLKDLDGNSYLAIYNEEDNSYILYQEFKFNSLTLNILNEKVTVPSNYKKENVKIGDTIVTGYKTNNNSNYFLIYAVNLETGIKNLYLYESSENTVQIYNDAEINDLLEKNKNANMLIYGLGSGIVLLSILLFIVASSKTKIKTKKNKEEKQIVSKDNKINDKKEKKKEKNLEITKELKKIEDIKKEKDNIIDLTKKDDLSEDIEKSKKKKPHDIFDDW